MGEHFLLEYVCNKTASPILTIGRTAALLHKMCKSISVYLAFNKLSQQLDAIEPETNAFTQRVLASTLWGRGFYSQVGVGNSFTAISQM